jgi:hypothetical protein
MAERREEREARKGKVFEFLHRALKLSPLSSSSVLLAAFACSALSAGFFLQISNFLAFSILLFACGSVWYEKFLRLLSLSYNHCPLSQLCELKQDTTRQNNKLKRKSNLWNAVEVISRLSQQAIWPLDEDGKTTKRNGHDLQRPKTLTSSSKRSSLSVRFYSHSMAFPENVQLAMKKWTKLLNLLHNFLMNRSNKKREEQICEEEIRKRTKDFQERFSHECSESVARLSWLRSNLSQFFLVICFDSIYHKFLESAQSFSLFFVPPSPLSNVFFDSEDSRKLVWTHLEERVLIDPSDDHVCTVDVLTTGETEANVAMCPDLHFDDDVGLFHFPQQSKVLVQINTVVPSNLVRQTLHRHRRQNQQKSRRPCHHFALSSKSTSRLGKYSAMENNFMEH